MFGSLLGGFLADYLGRKPTLLLVAIPYLIGYLLIAFTQLITSNTIFMATLFAGRFFTGVGLGCSCLAVPVSFHLFDFVYMHTIYILHAQCKRGMGALTVFV